MRNARRTVLRMYGNERRRGCKNPGPTHRLPAVSCLVSAIGVERETEKKTRGATAEGVKALSVSHLEAPGSWRGQ